MGEPSANGEAKNACVLLLLDVAEKDGEGRGEGTWTSERAEETEEADVNTLSREERGDDVPEEDEGARKW